jgi:hypothetical protein
MSNTHNEDHLWPKGECLHCGAPFRGRADKKFCTEQCRNAHNLQKVIPTISRINKILRRNREILKEVIKSGSSAEVDKRVLEVMDFNFYYHTHYSKDDSGSTTYFCYEYGFRYIRNAVFVCETINLPGGEVH